jgi:dolichol-phosphate mannosyltransferase
VLSSGIRDNTAGFRCFHTEALRSSTSRRARAGLRVPDRDGVPHGARRLQACAEIPIHFVDRRVGKSKMDGKIAREALLLVPRLRKALVQKSRLPRIQG